MSKSVYDFSKVPNYTKRQMFLDPAGPVTIQRFDEFAYPQIDKYYETQRSFFWIPQEINLTKDKLDFKNASKAIKHIFTSNILRQTALDSIQGTAPSQIFVPVASVPELVQLVNEWTYFEGIHSNAYSHIVRNIYNLPVEEFNKIHDTQEIISMASSIGKYYNDLHVANSKVVCGIGLTEYEHIKAIWLALIASYALEAIRFIVSFSTSFGMVENKIFIGNGNEVALIFQDELLHTAWTRDIINLVVRDDPRFAQMKIDCAEEAYQIFMDVIQEEKNWGKYLFKYGSVLGLNAELMDKFVDETAQERLSLIGVKYNSGVKQVTFPWFKKHMNTSKTQTALQESESVSYVLNAMTNDPKIDELNEKYGDLLQ